MKVALINPNSPFLINEKVFPNMGLIRVGTQLKNEGHNINIIDFAGKTTSEINTRIKNVAYDYDIYGFSSTTPQFPYIMKIFNSLKEVNSNAKTILGGPHASALYHLKQKNVNDININDLEVFDTIFAGEGEEISKIFNNGWQKGNLIKDLDSVLVPDGDLINLKSYDYKLFEKSTTSIQTQRGCPHQCVFCSGRDIEMYNKTRMHSPERVVKELDELHDKHGYSSFMIYDDEVNLNINRLEKLCNELNKRDYQFRGFIRSDMITKHPESVKWMKDAGFVKLCAGVESGSDRMLKNINKKTTQIMNTIARKIVKKQKIHYEAFLLLGHPDETINDIAKTYSWLKKNKPDDFDLNLITPYPGSKMYDDAVPSKKFKNYGWEYNGMFFNKVRYSQEDSYYKGLNQQSHSDVRTNKISNEQLKKLRDKMDRSLRK